MAKPTARQVWQQLVDEAGELEMERVLSMSQEEVDGELEAYGFDVAAEKAKGEKFLEDLARGLLDLGGGAEDRDTGVSEQPASAVVAVAQPMPPVPAERRRRPRTALVLLIAATAAAIGGGAIYTALHRGEAPLPPAPQPPMPAPSPSSTAPGPLETAPPDLIAAASLRKEAFVACDDGRWAKCLSDLDQARRLDPAGDDAPAVKSARERAKRGMHPDPQQPPLK